MHFTQNALKRACSKLFLVLSLIVLLVFTSQDTHAASKPKTAERTWVAFTSHYYKFLGFGVPIMYLYNEQVYIPFNMTPLLVKGTYSEFDIVWNPTKKRTEIKTHTPTKAVWKEFKMPQTITVNPAGASIHIEGKTKRIEGFLYEQTFFVRPEDIAKIVGFEIKYVKDDGSYLVKPELPQGIKEIPTQLKDINSDTLYYYGTSTDYLSRWSYPKQRILLRDKKDLLYMTDVSNIKEIHIFRMSSNGENVEQKTIKYGEEQFAGHFNGRNHHYLVFGNENDAENDNHPVIVLKKYDKEFHLVDTLNITSAYTTKPFEAGSLHFSEHPTEDLLIMHTARQRYTSSDGLRHQSQLTIAVDTKQMKVVNDLGIFQRNHVSHSFNQFVFYENSENLVLFDHGDAYPRSIHMTIMDKYARKVKKTVTVLPIPGPTGANQTGLGIGNILQTKQSYVIATNQIDYTNVDSYVIDSLDIKDGSGKNVIKRDIVVHIVGRNNHNVHSVNITQDKDANTTYSVPKAIDLENGNIFLMWEKKVIKSKSVYETEYDTSTEYVIINEQGKHLTPITPVPFLSLDRTDPILENGNITWMLHSENRMYLMQFDVPDKWLKK